MTKAITITPNEVTEVDDWEKHEVYRQWHMRGHVLDTPIMWFRKEHSLTIYMVVGADETDGLNHEATTVYNALSTKFALRNPYDLEPVYGTVFIVDSNEDIGDVDFTINDYHYVMRKIYQDT